MSSKINLYHCDCQDFMRDKPDKYYKLAIVDPPYFSGPERREFYGQKNSKIGVKRVYKKSVKWEIPKAKYFKELLRVSEKYIIWGENYFAFAGHSGRIVWDKINDSSDFSDCEIAVTNLFDHVRIFRFMWNGMLQGESLVNGTKMQGNKKKNEIRIHPTQKPVALYKWLLMSYANPGDNILDTHGGSMSSAIACHDMGFDLDLCEIDADYFCDGKERLEKHQRQLTFEF